MNLPFDLIDQLKIASGLFWSLVYLLIIGRSFRDKTYGMPVVALCANISWEFIFSFILPHPKPQLYIDMIWFLLDAVILVQYLKFGKAEFNPNLPQRLFFPTFLVTLLLSFLLVLLVTYEFKDWSGRYSAFGQNLMMSVMFLSLLLKRNHLRGQSVSIAVCKMLGTLFPSVLFYCYYRSNLLTLLSLGILIFDWAYIVLLYAKCKELGKKIFGEKFRGDHYLYRHL